MDRISVLHVQRLHSINRLADYIHHASLDLVSSWHSDRTSRGNYFQVTLQTVSVVHGHATNRILSDVLLHFYDKICAVGTSHLQGIVNLWKHFLRIFPFRVEIHIDHWSDNLGNATVNL